MNTPLIALVFIALIGLSVMTAVSFDSGITGQGIKIIKPPEDLKEAIEGTKKDFPGEPIFTSHECLIYKEIYKLRKELNFPTDYLESTKKYCKKLNAWSE